MASNDFVLVWRVNPEDLIPEELFKVEREEQVERFAMLLSDIQDSLDINQDIVAPFPLTMLSTGTPYVYATAPSGVQEWNGQTYLRAIEDLQNVVEARVFARVTTASNAAAVLAIQGSVAGAGSFDYLDGVDGPNVALASTGTIVSGWVPVTGDLRVDAELRVVHVGGNSTASPAITQVGVKFR